MNGTSDVVRVNKVVCNIDLYIHLYLHLRCDKHLRVELQVLSKY